MSYPTRKLSRLESVRGFAAVYVVFHHAFSKGLVIMGRDFSVLFRFGQEAVILFFLLSGFVIQYAYLRSPDRSFKTFFRKRFLRIYVPLLVVFPTNSLLYYLEGNYSFSSHDFWTFWGNIFMLQDIPSLKPNVICAPFLGNSPLWSLSYEWWFYMLFFMLVRQWKGQASKWVYAGGTVATLTYLFFPNFVNRELMYFIIWWIGADMARLYLSGKEISLKTLRVPLGWLLLNVLLLAAHAILYHGTSGWGVSPFLELRHFAFAFAVVLGALGWKKVRWVGFRQTLGLFGVFAPISFGIYISHWFLVIQGHYLDELLPGKYLRFIGYFAVCCGYAYLVERVIYGGIKKSLDQRRRLAKKVFGTTQGVVAKAVELNPTKSLRSE